MITHNRKIIELHSKMNWLIFLKIFLTFNMLYFSGVELAIWYSNEDGLDYVQCILKSLRIWWKTALQICDINIVLFLANVVQIDTCVCSGNFFTFKIIWWNLYQGPMVP